jgi:hypothetical protein
VDFADRIKQRSEGFPHSDVYTPRMGEPGGIEPRAGD